MQNTLHQIERAVERRNAAVRIALKNPTLQQSFAAASQHLKQLQPVVREHQRRLDQVNAVLRQVTPRIPR